ncbi:hypothetical protein BEH94_07480 [Candidatus Altiarchaeales archaeon WOR_SM1_SCG]|nr:hypothetical protein BEH94_07480 [Candidatus Altiarchaeales archaeon WOR_SM1_SCG]
MSTKYSKLHIEKAKRFLEAAENDLEDGFYDASISHSYYAMHHSARALLLLIGKSPRKHSGVINVLWQEVGSFSEINEDDVKKLSSALRQRVECDYGVALEPAEEDITREIFNNAINFVDEVEKELKEWENSSSSTG